MDRLQDLGFEGYQCPWNGDEEYDEWEELVPGRSPEPLTPEGECLLPTEVRT